MSDRDDPVDRARTSRPEVGMALKDGREMPGYLLIVVAVLTLVGCLTAVTFRDTGWAIGFGAVVLGTATAGIGWILAGRHRTAKMGNHRRHP